LAKIAFVQELAVEQLGVMYLSAVLKQSGHQVDLFILEKDEAHLAAQIAAFGPDIAAFSVTTGSHHWAASFACRLKQAMSVLTVFGGPHPTFFPGIVEHEGVDMVCQGEGEHVIVELADKADRGIPPDDTLNCLVKTPSGTRQNPLRPLIADLDSLPFPDREIYRSKYPYLRKSQATFMAGRGCGYRCSFCFNHALRKMYRGLGPYLRFRSPTNVIDEIVSTKARWGIRTVYMQDDTLLLNKRWVQEFADMYASRVGSPLLCLVRADQLDEESVSALKRAGLRNAFFGIESGDEHVRNDILKKSVKDSDIYRAARLLRKHGIRFRTYNMVGLPGETLEQALRTVQINADIRTDFPWCSLFQPFPGTELAEYAQEMGLLSESPEDITSASFFKDTALKSPAASELVNLQRLFYFAVRFPLLIPLVKKLIRLKPNPVFDMLFLLGYALSIRGSENLTVREVVSLGVRNVGRFFFGKQENSTDKPQGTAKGGGASDKDASPRCPASGGRTP
jgi:anaerobic magnesium-protoporphyrin IX monomethyl ester cyclase